MKITGKLGKGSYGSVYKGIYEEKEVALKRNFTDACIDFSGNLRELDILRRLQTHSSVVRLEKAITSLSCDRPLSPIRNRNYKEDYIFFIFEKATYDLHHLIYRRNLSWNKKKEIMMQLLCGLQYITAENVMHRDIKPSNILWDGKRAKFCDFGLSKVHCGTTFCTPKVSTVCYRSPEMNYFDYDFKTDVWSLGCVFLEMIMRKPFLVGTQNEMNNYIMSFTEDNIRPRILSFLSSWEEKIAPDEKEELINLLEGMLQPSPEKRFSSSEALSMPFFSSFRPRILRFSFRDEKRNVPKVKEREEMMIWALFLYDNRTEINWFSNRILFTAITLFDRYLNYLVQTYPLGTKEDGSYHSSEGTLLRFSCCLYMAAKYFSTLLVLCPFLTFLPLEIRKHLLNFPDKEILDSTRRFEEFMTFTVCLGEIYISTPYEMSEFFTKDLDEDDIRSLLQYYGKVSGCYSSTEIYASWLWK